MSVLGDFNTFLTVNLSVFDVCNPLKHHPDGIKLSKKVCGFYQKKNKTTAKNSKTVDSLYEI